MASQVFDEPLHLTVEVVEAESPTAAQPEGYPLPRLRGTGRFTSTGFSSWVLENDLVRVRVVPDLGGRILSYFDKRCGREILPLPDRFACVPGPPRGVMLPAGVQFRLRAHDRPNAMGSVHAQTTDQEEDASLWLGEVETGSGLSFHLALTLPPDSAALRIECRVVNRSLRLVSYHPRLTVFWPGATRYGEGIYDEASDAGLAICAVDDPLDLLRYDGSLFERGRFPEGSSRFLGPRQTDTWSANLNPLSGLGSLVGAGAKAALSLTRERLRMQVPIDLMGAKLLLATADGATLEAPADIKATKVLEIPLVGIAPPVALAVRDSQGNEAFRWEDGPLHSAHPYEPPPPIALPEGLSDPDLGRGTFSPAVRAEAHLRLAISAFGRGDYPGAVQQLESSLLYNAEDPLAWWAKAVAFRLEGAETEDDGNLLNAHFLAPLEPLLVAEAFLGQSPMMTSEPNALVAVLDDDPEALVEVAAVLLEHRLFEQATRWIDEALRHHELAALRFLLAYAYLTASRMRVEAAQQVDAALKLPLAPPFPWRPMELAALDALVAAFPANDALRDRLALASQT